MSCSINTLLSQSLLCFKVIITKCVLTQSQSRNEDHIKQTYVLMNAVVLGRIVIRLNLAPVSQNILSP